MRVNGVAPGSVDSPMLRESIALAKSPDDVWATIKALHPLGRAANAEEIAEVVAFLASSAASFITGESTDFATSAFAPILLRRAIAHPVV